MTICIAAIGQDPNNDELVVFATDHMITHPLGQFEMSIEKYKQITDNSIAMLSGKALIFSSLIKDCNECGTFNDMVLKIQENMVNLKNERIQKEILDKYKVDFDFIKANLNAPLNNDFVRSIYESITTSSLESMILLIGFEEEEAQISEITETKATDMRDMSFDAIGSGAVQALNTLLFQRHSKTEPLPVAVYNVYKAKRNAEVAEGVGKETDMMVLCKSGVKEIDNSTLNVLSEVYEQEVNHGKKNEKVNEAVSLLMNWR